MNEATAGSGKTRTLGPTFPMPRQSGGPERPTKVSNPDDYRRQIEEGLAVFATSNAMLTAAQQENIAKEAEREAHITEAQANDLCPGFIHRRKTPSRPAAEEPCCREPIKFGRGYCRIHYLTQVLKIGMRPFRAARLPLGQMTERQHRILEKLPLDTSLEAAFLAMNEAERRKRPLILEKFDIVSKQGVSNKLCIE